MSPKDLMILDLYYLGQAIVGNFIIYTVSTQWKQKVAHSTLYTGWGLPVKSEPFFTSAFSLDEVLLKSS